MSDVDRDGASRGIGRHWSAPPRGGEPPQMQLTGGPNRGDHETLPLQGCEPGGPATI